MPYKDLREFMDVLAKRGELKSCQKKVDTKIEIAKVTDKSTKVGGPAILFKNVKGFKTPVVSGLYSTIDRNFLAIDSNKYDGFRKLDQGVRNPIPHPARVKRLSKRAKRLT
jgi:4-hydroxy-3-polyprenylbenzoate decarboxylase